MLKRFDRFLYNVISEQSENEDDAKKKAELFTTNEFFFKYVQPVAEESNVFATRQRENAFLVCGALKDIKTFFSKFKVDSIFMENPADFRIYSPLFTYGEVIHNLKFDEEYPIYNDGSRPTQTHELDNIAGNVVEGRWYSLFDEDSAKRIKGLKPADVSKYFKDFYPKANKKFNEDTTIYVEFQVNCSRRANQVYDEMSEYAKNPDEMNDAHNQEPDDFDYTQLNIKNENDEATVKAALKDVKRSDKNLTSKR